MVSQHVATFEPVGIRQEYFNAIKTNEKVTLVTARSARERDGESTCVRVSELERENNKMSVNQANPRHVSASLQGVSLLPLPFPLSPVYSQTANTQSEFDLAFVVVVVAGASMAICHFEQRRSPATILRLHWMPDERCQRQAQSSALRCMRFPVRAVKWWRESRSSSSNRARAEQWTEDRQSGEYRSVWRAGRVCSERGERGVTQSS